MARSGLRVIGARHEQTVAYMAFGYAQATGRTGVYSVVPGPGFLNSSAALISAYGASAPVVCITGEIQSAFIGRGFGHLHELPDQLATMRSLTKWAATVEHPSQASELTAQAFYHARSGRPRPTAIAVPRDVLAAPVPSGSLPVNAAPPVPLHPPELDRGAIAAAAGLLAGASNPMIMVGAAPATPSARWANWLGGCRRRSSPSAAGGASSTMTTRSASPAPRASAAGPTPMSCSASDPGSSWPGSDGGVPPSLRTVLIDIDPVQAVRLEPEVAVVADAREAAAGAGHGAGTGTGQRGPIAARSSGPPRNRRPGSSATWASTWTTWRRSGPRCPPTASSWRKSARPASPPTSGSRCTRRASSSAAAIRARSGSATPPHSASRPPSPTGGGVHRR